MSGVRVDELGRVKRIAYRLLELCDRAGCDSLDGTVREVDMNHLSRKVEELNRLVEDFRKEYGNRPVPQGS